MGEVSAQFAQMSPEKRRYILRHLPVQLVSAEHVERLHFLLTNFDFIASKIHTFDPQLLIDDYDLALASGLVNVEAARSLEHIRDALQRSAHIIETNPTQLVEHLFGRLVFDDLPAVKGLLDQARQAKVTPWLRPLLPTLRPSGGPLLRVLSGLPDTIKAVALTSDGQRAVSLALTKNLFRSKMALQVWDIERGKLIRTLTWQGWPPHALALTADGQRAVVVSGDSLEVWDLEDGTKRTLESNTPGMVVGAVTRDGSRAVTATNDGVLILWDLRDGTALRTISYRAKHLMLSLAMTPDGHRTLIAGDDGTLIGWDLEYQTELIHLTKPLESFSTVALTPDGRRAIIGKGTPVIEESCPLTVWDLERQRELYVLHGHMASITAVAVMADGRHAISASEDGVFKEWDLEHGIELHTFHAQNGRLDTTALAPDARRALSVASNRTLKVWSFERAAASLVESRLTESIVALAVTADGSHVLAGLNDNTIRVWDLRQMAVVATLTDPNQDLTRLVHSVSAITVTVDGKSAASAAGAMYSDTSPIRVWDLERGRILRELEGHRAVIWSVAFTPDGQQVLSASEDHTLVLWDIASDSAVCRLIGHEDAVTSVAMLPDGQQAISASRDRTLKIWDLVHGTEQLTLHGHTHAVLAVALLPDGQRAVSASEDHTLRVWDLGSGMELAILEAHSDAVAAVAVAPHGQYVVSASYDHTLIVWDLVRGKPIACFIGEAAYHTCAVALDGRTVIAGDELGRMQFLRLEGV